MAEGDDDASKTEEPTAKKLSDARSKGDLPVSRYLNSWAIVFTAALLLAFAAGPMVNGIQQALVPFIAQPHAMPSDIEGMGQVIQRAVIQVASALGLPLILIAVAGVAASMYQTGGPLVTGSKLEPKLSAISPVAGFKRIFSKQGLVELGKAVATLIIIGLAVAYVVMREFEIAELMVGRDMITVLVQLRDSMLLLISAVLIAALTVTVFDVVMQRMMHRKKLRMTKQEIKDEHKQAEGDPLVKGKIRALRMEKAKQRIAEGIARASVLITNPTHFAIALAYDQDSMAAPQVTAKGVDHLALRMREMAAEHDIPIIENPPLARTLYHSVEVDQEIRPEHYKAVAEIISYVMGLGAGAGGAERRAAP